MFNVIFVFEDGSRLCWLVEANSERSAVNAVLNKTKRVDNPNFVIIEKPCIVASDEDIDLLGKFESWGGEYENVFNIENKLAEIVDIGGIRVCIGSLAERADLLNMLEK